MTREKQLKKIQNRINELYDLIKNYMKGATEEEIQAIPLYSYGINKGLTSLLWTFNLVYTDWIDRETLQNFYGVKPKYIDEVITELDDDVDLFDDSTRCVIYDVINEVENRNEG